MVSNNLKEYYIKLHSLYNNAVNMLTAINQSLTTTASQVSVEIVENNNTITQVKIPSFLHLDNKLEQLENSFSNLFNLPESGEAWFSNDGNMYKLQMVRANTAPISPGINTSNIVAGFENNLFIKDLVNPRTYLRIKLDNVPNNIGEMFMKKIVFLNNSLYTEISKLNLVTYEDYVSALYNYRNGIDYEEYDTTLSLPIKHDKYVSEFKITSVLEKSTTTNDYNNLIYTVKLDTLEYHNAEDLSETHYLREGDYLCVGNQFAIYKVEEVDYTLMNVRLVETVGHIALQPYSENTEMVFQKYNFNYDDFSYIDVPIEENQYITIFLGTIYNGIRSTLSEALLLDLGSILMTNADGSYMKDGQGNTITYIEYYNKYCNNIGDLILGLTQSAYPQISNYNVYQLKQLQESIEISKYVTGSFGGDKMLSVLPINSHIFDDKTIETIKNYHTQKSSLQSSLNTLAENINTTNNTLLTTDWSQETSITQKSLQSQLQTYYTERLNLEKQLNAVINEINVLSKENNVTASTKYRIRGVTNISELDLYIKSLTNSKVNLIGLDVEYKYKSVSRSTNSVSNINNSVFSDWNKLQNIERQRKLFFDETTKSFNVDFVNYDSISNIIKWNQIDIPINPNEQVIIRVRYKYNIGQPFIDLYTPWSDEITVSFPSEYVENVEVSQIINDNDSDTLSSKFSGKLINDGYQEHITNKLIASNQTFFHMPENIYSGFNTSENNLLSLKDKLNLMCADIDTYKELVETENKKRFQLYLQYDGKLIELTPNATNKISIVNIDHISDTYIKKEMNIVIKNTGDSDINLYSIFPGNIDTPLSKCVKTHYLDKIVDYYQLPIFVANKLTEQLLGQWIYFRQHNIFTGETCLLNENPLQQKNDYEQNAINKDASIVSYKEPSELLLSDNLQLGLKNIDINNYNRVFKTSSNALGFIEVNSGEVSIRNSVYSVINNNMYISSINSEYHQQENDNMLLYRYSDITGTYEDQSNKTTVPVKLTPDTSISDFNRTLTVKGFNSNNENNVSKYDGAFFYVNLENISQILTDGSERGNKIIPIGDSVAIPIVFEYFLSKKEHIKKQLMFDIKNSLLTNPLNYIIEVTAHYDSSLEAQIYLDDNYLIVDEASE